MTTSRINRVLGTAWPTLTAAALIACSSARAELLEYTNTETGPDKLALGYAVPRLVESTAPVDGFRSFESLQARHQGIALTNPQISATSVGSTAEGRTIWAYVASTDGDLRADGSGTKPATLVNGTIHAREWASPEVVTALLERVDAGSADGGLAQFLVENTRLVIVPVLNPDGFVQTQRTPALVVESTFSGDPPAGYPRDGRMRRKNKRGVDDDVRTEADALGGVDLNRNSNPYWASSARSSGDARSLVHHGSRAASEPETRALQAAAALGPADRLRYYTDVHSFSRLFFGNNTFNTRRNRNANALIARVGRAAGGYPYDPSPAGVGIGATDEYFSYTYEIPAYTLEIEPSPRGGVDYGGNGVSHDGFILPETEIARVRDTLSQALLLGAYHQAGPPALIAARVERADASLAFAARWVPDGQGARELVVSTPAALQPDTEYAAVLQFDKPMRHRDLIGEIAQYPGQGVALAPTVWLTGRSAAGEEFSRDLPTVAAGWLSDGTRYRDDTFRVVLDTAGLSELVHAQRLEFTVSAQDMGELALDAFPGTGVDWVNGGWAGYEDASGDSTTDRGGTDRSMRLIDDGSPIFESAGGGTPGSGGMGGGMGGDTGGGSSGALPSAWLAMLLALAGWRGVVRAGGAAVRCGSQK